MLINITNRERATILAALRRWHSYPAAREADSIATCGGKCRPLDNSEIERLSQRMTKAESKRGAAPVSSQSGNGARKRKVTELRDESSLVTRIAANQEEECHRVGRRRRASCRDGTDPRL